MPRFRRDDCMSVIKPKLRAGQVVATKGNWGYGVVAEVWPVPNRWGTPFEYRAWVHYIDPQTGRQLACVDRDRCSQKRGCPLHGESMNASMPPADCVFPDYDLAFYAAAGMLHHTLAAEACTDRKLPELDPGDQKLATELKVEWAVNVQPKE